MTKQVASVPCDRLAKVLEVTFLSHLVGIRIILHLNFPNYAKKFDGSRKIIAYNSPIGPHWISFGSHFVLQLNRINKAIAPPAT